MAFSFRIKSKQLDLDEQYPIGSMVIQFPSANVNITDASSLEQVFPVALNPASRFGGTWADEFEDEAIFFRTRGAYLETDENVNRTTGKQIHQILSHKHYKSDQNTNSQYELSTITGGTNDWIVGSLVLSASDKTGLPQGDGTNTLSSGKENYPVNKLIRVFIRTA